jgi:hypothetical protein
MRRSHNNICPLCDKDFGIDKEQLVAHARKHFREDYLTLPQVKALRKITGLISPSDNSSSSSVASNYPTPGQSRVLDVERAFQQISRSIHGTEISIKTTDAEKYSLLTGNDVPKNGQSNKYEQFL